MSEPNIPTDLDDLLDTPPTAAEKAAVQEAKDGGVPAESPEQARIRELEAKLAAAEAAAATPEKTQEQKQLEHNQAVRLTSSVLSAPDTFEEADGENVIHLHVLESGITVFGTVWHVGQELVIDRDGEAYKDTLDRLGNTWLDDLSPAAQIKRWRKIRFGIGPWPFEPYTDGLAAQDDNRKGAVPVTRL